MRYAAPRRAHRRTESWQVIYMDLMTIIMVFFVILWSINQRQEEGLSETVGDETVKMVSLPGDVLFASGASALTKEGKKIFKRLFGDDSGAVLDFETGGLTKRMMVIHGHTDGDGSFCPLEKAHQAGNFEAFSSCSDVTHHERAKEDKKDGQGDKGCGATLPQEVSPNTHENKVLAVAI